jgi:hypothetical protein
MFLEERGMAGPVRKGPAIGIHRRDVDAF